MSLVRWREMTQNNEMVMEWPTPPFQPMHVPTPPPIHITASTLPSPPYHSPVSSSPSPSPQSKSSPTPTTIPSRGASQSSHSSNLLPPPSPPPPVILSPCAACKILRRRCAEKCVLAPYFPPTEPLKFAIAHRVFGASNIIKFLLELPEHQRADAVSSLVYEANARIRDPVYGCAGVVFQLQKQVSELHAELAMAKVDLDNMQLQQANLLALIAWK